MTPGLRPQLALRRRRRAQAGRFCLAPLAESLGTRRPPVAQPYFKGGRART